MQYPLFRKEDGISMKTKRILCTLLAAATLIMPILSGCKHVEKKELFKVESTTSEEGVSDTETSQTESSSVSENANKL